VKEGERRHFCNLHKEARELSCQEDKYSLLGLKVFVMDK
jgi:hypothetical protein